MKLDDLEHDSHEDINQQRKRDSKKKTDGLGKPRKAEDQTELTPNQRKKQGIKESMGMRENDRWLNAENPAIWDGEI